MKNNQKQLVCSIIGLPNGRSYGKLASVEEEGSRFLSRQDTVTMKTMANYMYLGLELPAPPPHSPDLIASYFTCSRNSKECSLDGILFTVKR